MTTQVQPVLRRRGSEERSLRTRKLFESIQFCDSEEERRASLDAIIELHLDLAHAEAARYRNRGIALEDLRQVAAMALTSAVHRYDVSRGHEFLAYALPTIRGELRKHFRDRGWMIRPPRRIQELQGRISAAEAELSNHLGRSPKPVEVAQQLDEPVESVVEALASDGCFVPASLDYPIGSEDFSTLGDLLSLGTTPHQAIEARVLLGPLVRRLADRDREILRLRFYEELTQREIAARIGVTQMQVSRILTRILGQLRSKVGEMPLG